MVKKYPSKMNYTLHTNGGMVGESMFFKVIMEHIPKNVKLLGYRFRITKLTQK